LIFNLPGFTFLVPAHPRGPGNIPEEQSNGCVCVCVCVCVYTHYTALKHDFVKCGNITGKLDRKMECTYQTIVVFIS